MENNLQQLFGSYFQSHGIDDPSQLRFSDPIAQPDIQMQNPEGGGEGWIQQQAPLYQLLYGDKTIGYGAKGVKGARDYLSGGDPDTGIPLAQNTTGKGKTGLMAYRNPDGSVRLGTQWFDTSDRGKIMKGVGMLGAVLGGAGLAGGFGSLGGMGAGGAEVAGGAGAWAPEATAGMFEGGLTSAGAGGGAAGAWAPEATAGLFEGGLTNMAPYAGAAGGAPWTSLGGDYAAMGAEAPTASSPSYRPSQNYGEGMSGAQTSAYDSTMNLTGSRELAKVASSIAGVLDGILGPAGGASNYGGMASGLLGLYSDYKKKKQLGGLAQGLKGLFGPNSAYSQQMQKQLQRQDAASGRRSQYGPRNVELQARLAEMASRQVPTLQSIYTQQGNTRNDMYSGLLDLFKNQLRPLGG